jgi:hypothetical protein
MMAPVFFAVAVLASTAIAAPLNDEAGSKDPSPLGTDYNFATGLASVADSESR